MTEISSPVGGGQTNNYGDVKTVQDLLNRNIKFLVPLKELSVDGRFGPATANAIREFQLRVLHMEVPDGVVIPKGPTMRSLVCHAVSSKPLAAAQSSAQGGLTFSDYAEAARKIGCEPAAVQAVVMTELGIRGPFDGEGRPPILFERHVFSRLTGGRFDKTHPEISNPVPGGYGYFSAQYSKLERASKLDEKAALMSASWGAFQIMGENFEQAGFGSVADFVTAMKTSTKEQLAAFITFVLHDKTLVKALLQKDWPTFAKKYNGPSYRANDYDNKMKHNYQEASMGQT